MIPRPSEVIRVRFWAAAITRVLGLGFLLLALILYASWWIEGISDGDLLNFSYYSGRIIIGTMMLGMGLAGLLMANPLARLVVRLPPRDPQCPSCGYTIVRSSSERCPECGLDLDREFSAPSPMQPPPLPVEAVSEEMHIRGG
jgi:hypothetical protein